MKCQRCPNPATVHLTEIVDQHKKELHLCQSCAEAQNLLQKQDLNLSAILQTLIENRPYEGRDSIDDYIDGSLLEGL